VGYPQSPEPIAPTPIKIVIGVCMFIPLVSLITLLLLNSRATTALRAAGYRVGLLGASKA